MSQVRNRRNLSLLTALVTMLTVLVFPTGGAFAADVAVDCSTDDLQTAINGATSGDNIIITDGTTCTGNFDVNKPLVIRAETAAGATIDGGGADTGPVVTVSTGGTVAFQNVTISGGVNTSPANSGLGGGLFIGGATVNVTDSTITGNSADTGAGIYNGGILTISGGSITDNTAVTNGGGIFSNGTVTLSGVMLGTPALPNTAGQGGGAYNNGTMTVNSSSVVDSNVATGVTGGGGGLWNDGTLTVDTSVITGNVATDAGGGIHNTSGGTLTVTSSEVTSNDASAAGGILNNGLGGTGSTAVITDSLVSLNDAVNASGLGGGGIFNISFAADVVKADLTVTDSEVSFNTSAAEGAGGIRNQDSDATIGGSLIDSNDAVASGGGIRTSGTLVVTDSTLSGNSTDSSGGAIALDGDSSILQVRGSVIDGNSATNEGGGLSVGLTTSADITTSSVTRNSASAGAGISNAGTLSVTNTTVSANTASTQGGGFLTSGSLSVFSSTIATNDATNEGGGVRVIGVPTVTLTGTILWGNTGGSGKDCSGPLDSGGFNLVGSVLTPCVYGGDATDLPPGSDPMPGALGFYGETTEHHPLNAGSDAIDAGGDCGLTVDQIGAARPDGPACDVGAIEGVSTLMADDVLLVEPNGRWHIRVPGNPDYTFFFGIPGDIPIFGDWDGDGLDTPGAWRQGPGGGFAYMTNTLPPDGGSAVADFDFFFGIPNDEVFVGDWNGDGIDTLGINRKGHIFLTDTNGSGGAPVPTDYDFWFGVGGDVAFGGDGDGDGSDAVFLYRAEGPGAGFVYYTNETPVGPGAVATTADNFFFGIASDSFVAGDWNRDGVDTAGIFRSSDTTVYLTNTNASGGDPAPTDVQYVWGTAGWFPVAGVHGVG